MNINVTSVLSTLDSSTSLAGLGFKDSAVVAGLTANAYKTGGEHEAREKLIDETGTSILWLGGIPATRWLFDKTIFKWSGLDPEISIKKIPKPGEAAKPQGLTVGELRNFTKKVGKISEEKLKNLTDKQLVGKYKFLNGAKFLLSTAIPSLLIVILPKLNQQLSRKIILSRTLKEENQHSTQIKTKKNENKQIKEKNTDPISFEKNKNEVSNLRTRADNFFKNPQALGFQGVSNVILNTAANAQINPVGNILLVDAVISGNRVTFVPRNKQQRQENIIKEGIQVFFLFVAQGLIKKAFEKLSNIPVALDFKTLNPDKKKNKAFIDHMNKLYEASKNLASKEGKDKLIESAVKYTDGKLTPEEPQNKGLINTFKNFFKEKKTDTVFEKGVFDFVKDNHAKGESVVLNAAEQVGLLKTVEQDGKKVLNHKKYIETTRIKDLSENIGSFAKAMLDSGLKPEEYIKKARNRKAGLLLANLAICTAALGIVLPKIQYAFRKKVYGSNAYPGVKGYAEEAKKMTKKA